MEDPLLRHHQPPAEIDPRNLEEQRTLALRDAGIPSRVAGMVLETVRFYEDRGGADPTGYSRTMSAYLTRLGIPESQWSLFRVTPVDNAPRPTPDPADGIENRAVMSRLHGRAATDPGFKVYDENHPYTSPPPSRREVELRAVERRHADLLTNSGVPEGVAQTLSRAASSRDRNGAYNVDELNRLAARLHLPVTSRGINDPDMLTGRRALETILGHYGIDPANW